jgi:hypothetical protein
VGRRQAAHLFSLPHPHHHQTAKPCEVAPATTTHTGQFLSFYYLLSYFSLIFLLLTMPFPVRWGDYYEIEFPEFEEVERV